jgi:hypothetical protein
MFDCTSNDRSPSSQQYTTPLPGKSGNSPTNCLTSTTHPPGGAPAEQAADAPAAPLWTPLALLLEEDDECFSRELPQFVKTDQFGPHGASVLWRPEVFTRLCALSDAYFTACVLTLAHPEYVGLDLLFDERLLPRLAALRNGHLRGTFLPYARRLPGFDARDFLRDLHRTKQSLKAHLAATGTPLVVTMDMVEATPVTWLWWPYIALGKLTMLDGDPGIGKSLLMTQLAATLSRGYPLPDQEGRPTLETGGAHVTVMLSTEDGLADTLKPRLDAAGADSSQIKVLTGWVDTDGEAHSFSFQDMPMRSAPCGSPRPSVSSGVRRAAKPAPGWPPASGCPSVVRRSCVFSIALQRPHRPRPGS